MVNMENVMTKEEILAARKHLGLTQAQMASSLGISPRMVRYYEFGNDIPERTKISVMALLRECEMAKAIEKAGLKIV